MPKGSSGQAPLGGIRAAAVLLPGELDSGLVLRQQQARLTDGSGPQNHEPPRTIRSARFTRAIAFRRPGSFG